MQETGIELITKERDEHFTKHGLNVGMDVLHNNEHQLAFAAEKLCVPILDVPSFFPPENWSEKLWDKMTSKTYKQRLIIAGSLIVAEIDRLNAIEDNE